ncbi:hypothetical protein [Dongia sp.]|uniref:hypothetical protein n=1 Tax=Dongia sp. TaxID=1977262 RepID=UPI0035B46B7E
MDPEDRRSTHSSSVTAKKPAPQPLGNWSNGEFHFNSADDEVSWRRSAYRQSVNPDAWQKQAPVDDQLQATFEAMPELAAGQYFRGPDGRHRQIGPEQREAAEVAQIRRKAFGELARTGITWAELGNYGSEEPHPGEEEAITSAQSRTPLSARVQHAPGPLKTRDMGVLPEPEHEALGVARNLNLNRTDVAKAWSLPSSTDSQVPPALVANSGKLSPGGLPKGVILAPIIPYGRRIPPNFRERYDFNRRLVGVLIVGSPARPVPSKVASKPEPVAPPSFPAPSVPKLRFNSIKPVSNGSATPLSADPEFDVANPLFNWRRDGGEAPAPAEFAVHVASDEGRFSYLEDMKDEWSRLLRSNPEAVVRNMVSEVEKLSVAAQRDFLASYHRAPNAVEIAQINDAVEQIVFAPAERWFEGKRHLGGEPESKFYVGFVEPVTLPGEGIAQVFSQVAQEIAQETDKKTGGRPGNDENRGVITEMVQKLAAAIRACGGDVTGKFYGAEEKFIHSDKGTVLGGSYPDAFLPFTLNGRSLGFFANQTSTYADGSTLKPNEANQIRKLIPNIAHAMKEGKLEIEAAGIGHFPKRRPNQSMEDYLKNLDDFISKMINCKRPFLIEVKVEKIGEKAVKDLANDNKK